jgi:hypothetical protein
MEARGIFNLWNGLINVIYAANGHHVWNTKVACESQSIGDDMLCGTELVRTVSQGAM